MKTDELREKYLEFFVSKGCTRCASDVLVPTWDPSVLFTPAGMNPFKDHFLGKCKLEFTKATSCQKCLRTGDIDNVGRTAFHHTFFEMLGNFSFGDYFKREAITWAWEFLTSPKWLGLDGNRLNVTIYLDDEEAGNIWNGEVGLPWTRISRCDEAENFWPASAPSQGPDGVCGPCSEIYYQLDGGKSVEIWNLVFTQFNRVGEPPNNLRPLPSKNIDTGMGLERCASVLQGVDTNYHIDILRPIVETAGDICGVKYDPNSDSGRRLRRITDHVRACTFAMHENVYPGANEEKYVIRRLMRRAALDGHQLGLKEPFLYKLVPKVAEMMKAAYPELQETVVRVQGVMKQEENNFLRTIDTGMNLLENAFSGLESTGKTTLGGKEAFDLYQTYGFPPELSETLAADRKFTFDWAGYKKAMEEHGKVSGTGGKALFATGPVDSLKKVVHSTEFLGYEKTTSEAKIVGIIVDEWLLDEYSEAGTDKSIVVVLDKTPFYGESGGQVGDTGTITADGLQFEVVDTIKDGALFLHRGHLRKGTLKSQTKVTAQVDVDRRRGIRRAHSATHILHFALQKFLGSHAQQQGSKVDRDWLRFDFTNTTSIPADVLEQIETEVNDRITLASAVNWITLPLAEARSSGAMMLFGEKYPDRVRMVSVGDFSKELCAGTHVDNTGEIGLFRVLGEESVSAGTRRITAVVGRRALDQVRASDARLHEIATTLKAPLDQLPDRVAALAKEVRELKKKLASGPVAAGQSPEQLLADAVDIGGVKVICAELPGATGEGLRGVLDQLRRKGDPVAALLASRTEDSVSVVAGISKSVQEAGFSAVDWVRSVVETIGGKGGGGRPDLAQAGGKNPAGVPVALEQALTFCKAKLQLAKTK